jgi:hypothetical protein
MGCARVQRRTALVMALVAAACAPEPDDPVEVAAGAAITGSVVEAPGTSAAPAPARVAVYASLGDFDRGVAAGETVTADTTPRTFALELAPGIYYVDAWCDVDGDRAFSTADLYGMYAGAVTLAPDQRVAITIEVREIGGQRAPGRLSRAKSQWSR